MPEYDSMLSNSMNAKFRSWSSEYYNICVKYDSARENQNTENATKLFFSSRENETSCNYSELNKPFFLFNFAIQKFWSLPSSSLLLLLAPKSLHAEA